MVNLHSMFAFLISFFMIHTHNGRTSENPDLRTPLAVFFPLLSFKTNTTGCREWQNSLDDFHYSKNSWTMNHGESLMTLLWRIADGIGYDRKWKMELFNTNWLDYDAKWISSISFTSFEKLSVVNRRVVLNRTVLYISLVPWIRAHFDELMFNI